MFSRDEFRQIRWVDFGYMEKVPFAHLSAHIGFTEIPVQVRKCHLSNVRLISDQLTEQARELCNRLFCHQLCCIYIHDNCDAQHHASIACSVQSLNVPLDLASLLISKGLVQLKTNLNRDFQDDPKRIRKVSEEPITKSSSELHSFEDFREFYRTHKAKIPQFNATGSIHANDDEDDNDYRSFEVFDVPSKRSPLDEKQTEIRTEVAVVAVKHPIVDRITTHFKLMTVKRASFYCRCVLIIDPVTILIESLDAKPPKICPVIESPGHFPSEGKS